MMDNRLIAVALGKEPADLVIRNGQLVEKKVIHLPEKLVNVISCKNPRCISCTEQELPQVFVLTDRENGIYRCRYCETKAEKK